MNEKTPSFDSKTLEAMNEKAIQNQFFTPDHVYIDLGLFKDIPIGVVYADTMKREGDEEAFLKVQQKLLPLIPAYQKRLYDTVEPLFVELGYTDFRIDNFLRDPRNHNVIFMMAPATKFLNLLIRHTITNQNNSRPANKYKKIKLDKDKYQMQPVEVTYTINTFPLSLSQFILEKMGQELGESLGVNIKFICKDPFTFDTRDWTEWLSKIECFYLDSLGRFTSGDMIFEKQGSLELTGCYVFGRKRFERQYANAPAGEDFEHQIQLITANLDILCDFAWLLNSDLRLTENSEDIPVDEKPSTQP